MLKLLLVFDTSALVSLEAANLMNKVVEYFNVFVPEKVYKELREMANYDDVHGKAANRVLQMDGLEVRKAGDVEAHLMYVDEGEAEALDLAKGLGADYFVCDDYESFWYLTEKFEKTVFSVFVVKYLCEKGIIATEEGWKFIEMIRERRTWGDNILYKTAEKLWES